MVCIHSTIILSSLLFTCIFCAAYPWNSMTSLQQLADDKSPSIAQQNYGKGELVKVRQSLSHIDNSDEEDDSWSSVLDDQMDMQSVEDDEEMENSRKKEEKVDSDIASLVDQSLYKARIKAFKHLTYNIDKFIQQAMADRNLENENRLTSMQKKTFVGGNRRTSLGSLSVGGGNTRTAGPYTLSIVNPLEVLRRRLELEMARRRMKENRKQIKANEEILRNLG